MFIIEYLDGGHWSRWNSDCGEYNAICKADACRRANPRYKAVRVTRNGQVVYLA